MSSRSWSRTQTRYLAAPPERVWDVLSTPSLWPAFDDAVQRFTPVDSPTLVGPGGPRTLREGERVKVVPHARIRGSLHALTAPPATLTVLRTDQELQWRQDQPGGNTSQTWSLWPSGSGTRLTRRTRVEGPLTPIMAAALAAPLAADLGGVAARLVALAGAEAPEAAAAPLVVIAGGTGLLGERLAHLLLARGRDVVVLSRSPRPGAAYRQRRWDGATAGRWTELFDDPRGVDVVNLCGSRIGDAGGAAEMARLRTSRVNPTRALVAAASRAARPVRHWVQGSGVVLRHDPEEPPVHEDTVRAADGEELRGMTELVRSWEDAVTGARAEHLSIVRTGIVLDREAEAFRWLHAAAALGAGGALGSGAQWMPWIHVDDWMRITLAALGEAPDTDGPRVDLPDGPVIAAAPEPVRNRELMAVLREHAAPAGLGLPTPTPLLRLGTRVLGKDPAVLTGSSRAVSQVLPAAGFRFLHTDVERAVADLLS